MNLTFTQADFEIQTTMNFNKGCIMNKEELMKKVEKLLALAGNNPEQAEANSALAKAQKLIAEYNLDMGGFKSEKEIVMLPAIHSNNEGYRINLACVLAPNFRCKPIMSGNKVNFIGYKTDAEVCVKVFNYAYKVSHNQGLRLERQYRKEGKSTKGIANGYWLGFCVGIKQVLDEQCKSLMLVVPDEVNKEVGRRCQQPYAGGMRGSSLAEYNKGISDGRNHIRSRQVEGGC